MKKKTPKKILLGCFGCIIAIIIYALLLLLPLNKGQTILYGSLTAYGNVFFGLLAILLLCICGNQAFRLVYFYTEKKTIGCPMGCITCLLFLPLVMIPLEISSEYESSFLLNYHFRKFSNEVFSMDMPEKTVKIQEFQGIDNITNGGSNNLTVAVLMKTKNTEEDVRSFYKDKIINSVECKYGEQKASAVKIYFYSDGKLKGYKYKYYEPEEFDITQIFTIPKSDSGDNRYFVVFAECDVGATWGSAM